MAEAQGSFTVGSGGTYVDWAAALADIAATLTGDLTLTQISAIPAETGATTKTIALAGYTMVCTSAEHRGDPNGGYISTRDGAADNLNNFDINVTGTGKLEVSNLNCRATGTPSSITMIKVYSSGPDVDIHDCITIANETSGTIVGIQMNDDGGASGSTDLHMWNCVASGGAVGIIPAVGYSAVVVVENCTAFAANTCFDCSSDVMELLNCVAFDNTLNGDFVGTGSADGTNCASEDATAGDGNWSSGTGNITTIVPATEFVSISTSSADMVKVTGAGSLDAGGVVTTITENTLGIRGNARPGTDTDYSIGADELVINPTCTGVVPNDGVAAGGTPVSVGGTLFQSGATIKFGGVSATSVVFVGATELTCVTPAGTGVVDVVVTNTDSGFGTLAGGFSYLGGVATQKAVTVSTRLGEGSSGIVRSSPGLGDIMNKVADNLAFIKEASQQDNFAEFKVAMEDIDALQSAPRPRYVTPYPATVVPVQVPERFGDGRRISRAEASRLQGLLEVMVRVSEILEGLKSASQESDFAAFKTSVAALPTLVKSNDSKI